MDLTQRIEVVLEQEDFERFENGDPIQFPVGSRLVTIYPPEEGETPEEDEVAVEEPA